MYEDRKTGPVGPEKMNAAADCSSKAYQVGGEALRDRRPFTPDEQERLYLTGKSVFFAPPQACKGDTTPEFYAATIVKVNGPSPEHGQMRTVDLVTFGPNSLYFQHNVPFSGHGIKAGHWTYRE
jgi:hypothetical protein